MNQKSKGPEELARDYYNLLWEDCRIVSVYTKDDFIAGYNTATSQLHSRIKELEEKLRVANETKKAALHGFDNMQELWKRGITIRDELQSKITSLEAVVKAANQNFK